MRKRRPDAKLFSGFDTLHFASVMGLVAVVLLTIFMTATPMITRGISFDLPYVSHSVSMPNALQEDAMIASVTRDGKVYFGTDQIADAASLSEKIKDRLKDHGIERKVYINADMRARWANIKVVLDGVRSAGILRVAFLVNQRKG